MCIITDLIDDRRKRFHGDKCMPRARQSMNGDTGHYILVSVVVFSCTTDKAILFCVNLKPKIKCMVNHCLHISVFSGEQFFKFFFTFPYACILADSKCPAKQ